MRFATFALQSGDATAASIRMRQDAKHDVTRSSEPRCEDL